MCRGPPGAGQRRACTERNSMCEDMVEGMATGRRGFVLPPGGGGGGVVAGIGEEGVGEREKSSCERA